MMIFIQEFLPIHFSGNSTDKNLNLNLSLNSFLCGGDLSLNFSLTGSLNPGSYTHVFTVPRLSVVIIQLHFVEYK